MATTLALIEGFDTYDDAAQYDSLQGVNFGSAGWALKQPGRLAGFSFLGPNNTTNTLKLVSNRLTVTALAAGYFFMCGIRPQLASAQRRFRFLDDAAQPHVDIEITATGGFIVKRGDGTVLGSSVAGLVTNDVWGTLEIKVVVDDVSGIVAIKWNGVQVVNISSVDTRNAGNVLVGEVELSPDGLIDDIVGFISTSAGDAFPGPRKVVVKRPASDAAVQFARSGGTTNAENVDDDTPDDDVTYNESATVDQVDAFNLETVSETGSIDGVRTIMVARKTDVGIRKMKFRHTDGVTPVESAVESDLNTTYQTFDDMFPVKPAGGSWAAADVNNNDFGYKLTT